MERGQRRRRAGDALAQLRVEIVARKQVREHAHSRTGAGAQRQVFDRPPQRQRYS